ncbi:MAG: hypothetical protein IMZ46_04845, partial [Acidobacteria bacterium]|nr:hypothetical protein [Acidobacteriota bacterium]
SDLADGILLSHVLQDLDKQYDAADVNRNPPPSTPQWLVNKKNLQALHKALVRYINRECPEFNTLVRSADWQALAEEPSEEALVKVAPRARCVHIGVYGQKLTGIVIQLVSVIVGVAFLGPQVDKYVPRLQHAADLDGQTQMEIQMIILGKQKEMNKTADTVDADDSAMDSRDAELAFEQERATLRSQLEVAKKQHADTLTRLEYLQDSYDTLTREEAKLQRELEVLQKASQDGESGSQLVKSHQAKINELEDLISSQEMKLEDDRLLREALQSQVKTLGEKAERVERMDDDVRELKHENNELRRKANTADRLKTKLEQQRGLETEVENLRYEKDQLLKGTQESDRFHGKKIAALEKTIQEVRSTQSGSEETLFILNSQKRALEDEISLLKAEVSQLQEMRSHDERFITELQEQMSHSGGQSLEDELEGTPSASIPSLEVSRLRAENELLRRNADSGDARLELEEAQRKLAELQGRYTEIVEQHAVAQDQVSALVNDAAGEGSVKKRSEALSELQAVLLNDEMYRTRAFGELKKQLMQAVLDHQREKNRADDLEMQLADRDRDLLMARTELSAAGKGGEEALEELRATDGLISTGLRDELKLVRARARGLTEEVETAKTQAIEAFVSKDKVLQELDEIKGLKGRIDDGSISEETMATDTDKLNEKVEKLRERLLTRQEVSIGPVNVSPAVRAQFVGMGAEEP